MLPEELKQHIRQIKVWKRGEQRAAHFNWHQAGGPDLETNGLTFCSMRHKLSDRDASTLTHELRLCVSQKANGSTGLSEWLTPSTDGC